MLHKPIDKMLPFFLFALSFSIYIATLAPSLFWGDSPELAASAYTLGIAHPSGYPLYTIIGKLFTYIPLGTMAYRLNLMSAFFAALTAAVVYLIALKLTKNKTVGIFSSLTFAFSYTFWSQATIAEVYTLNAFFVAMLMLLLLKWKESLDARLLYASCFLFGLGLANHLTLVLILPASVYFVLANRKNTVFEPKKVCIMALLFAAGLLLYLYLPLRAMQEPFMNWGNPVMLKAFLEHVTGAGYRHYFMPTLALLNLKHALYFLLLQFPLTLGFSIVAIAVMWIKDRTSLIFLALIIIFNIAYNILYSIHDIIVYYIPTYIAFSLLIGAGLKATAEILFRNVRKAALYAAVGVALLLIMANMILILYPHAPTERAFNAADEKYRPLIYTELFPQGVNRHSFNAADAYASFILANAKPNAIVSGNSDESVFPLLYCQAVEGKRKDLIIVYSSMLTAAPWYAVQLKERYPELNLRIIGTEGNLSVEFDIPSVMYFIEKNPAFIEEFNQTHMHEYSGKVFAMPLAT